MVMNLSAKVFCHLKVSCQNAELLFLNLGGNLFLEHLSVHGGETAVSDTILFCDPVPELTPNLIRSSGRQLILILVCAGNFTVGTIQFADSENRRPFRRILLRRIDACSIITTA
jgi:hypothetical protein